MKLIAITAAALALTVTSFAPAYAAAAAATVTTPVATTTAKVTATTTKPAAPKPAKPAATPDPKRFSTEADAAKSCPTDTIVWANTKSKIFHLKDTATYGKGKNGVYMCQADATAEGFKATKKPEKVMTPAPAAAATTTTTTTTKSK